MYDFDEERPLSGLLELIKGAAVTVESSFVADYNSAAKQLLPELREGARLTQLEDGLIELCARRFEAAAYVLGESKIYVFAAPAQTVLDSALPFLDNLSRALFDSLSPSFVASELIAEEASRKQIDTLVRHNAILRHEQYRLLHLADNMHELCALASGENVLHTALFDISDLCRRITDTVRTLLKDLEISVEYSADSTDFSIYADERRIERALLALLANSAAACNSGGQIALSLRRESGQYRLRLTDNGCGIPEELYKNVFESFTRSPVTSDTRQGLGLSLLVARETVLRHGGSFILHSKSGQGTQIMISLPAASGHSKTLHTGRAEYAVNPMRTVLSEFSGILNYKAYTEPFI